MLLKDKIPASYIFGKIRYELLLMVGYSFLIWFLYTRLDMKEVTIPLSVTAIVGTVLSLLLGFRSNQAYDRWWEARQVWGAIVNDSRSISRQVNTFIHKEYDDEATAQFRARFIKRQIAWTYALGQMLRGKDALSGIDRLLSRSEYEYLNGYSNVPAGILALHGRDLKTALDRGWINRYQQASVDEMITRLCDAQGKCERIKNTVFPVTYSLYIHFSLLLFIGLLPLGLVEHFGIIVVPIVAAIAACFLLIEKMAIHLQDPFENKPTDTPVTTISKNIERDLRQMMHEEEIIIPANQVTESYYVM